MAHGTRRDLKKEAFWRRRPRGQAKRGLSVRAWCGRHAVRESAFYGWRNQLARRDAAAPFVPVRVAAESSTVAATGRIQIALAGDRRVHVVGSVDRQALTDVLTVLPGVPGATAEDDGVWEAPGC